MQPNSSSNSGNEGFLRSLGLPPPGELLPLGYLYLLMLGIANESIHFGLLGVNVLEYSNALDVLLSPIALITGELAVLAVVVLVPLFLWPYLALFQWWARKHPTEKNRKLRERPLGRLWLSMCAASLFFAFLGLGIGQGYSQGQTLRAGELEPDTRIVFSNGPEIEAYVVGVNSGYAFYVLEGETEVTISPIADNIQSIRAIANED